MADNVPPEIEQAGRDLSEAIIEAMAAWGDKSGRRSIDARVPLIALHIVLSRAINALPPGRRPGYAEDFIRALSNIGLPS